MRIVRGGYQIVAADNGSVQWNTMIVAADDNSVRWSARTVCDGALRWWQR